MYLCKWAVLQGYNYHNWHINNQERRKLRELRFMKSYWNKYATIIYLLSYVFIFNLTMFMIMVVARSPFQCPLYRSSSTGRDHVATPVGHTPQHLAPVEGPVSACELGYQGLVLFNHSHAALVILIVLCLLFLPIAEYIADSMHCPFIGSLR